jgi:caspase domain-containing protein
MGTMIRVLAIFLCGSLLLVGSTRAAGRGSNAERRIALIIGNNEYRYVTGLNNAVADARAMKRELEERGFQVVYRENAARRVMNDAIEEFLGKLSTDAIGMVYFSGHGVQINSANFLIPTDLQAEKESDVAYDGIELGRLLDRMAQVQPRFSLVVIDACRDNPFRGSGKSIGSNKGLAPPISNAEGVMVVYAAGANQQALDRLSAKDTDPNGLFTREFIKALRKPGLNVQDMISEIKLAVIQQAKSVGHVQTPAIYDQSVGTFIFSEGHGVSKPPPAADAGGIRPSPAPVAPEPAGESVGVQRQHVDIATLAGALASADVGALKSFAAVPASSVEEALRQRSGDGKSTIARRFFENSTRSSEAVAWFDAALGAGVDPNMTVPSADYVQEAVLAEAMRAGNVPATKALLRRGASPHAYQNLFLTTSTQPRFLFPLRFIAEDDRLSLNEKQDLAKAYLTAGAVVPKAIAPGGGSGWDSTMLAVNNLQDKVAPSLGIKLSPTPNLCEHPTGSICKASSRNGEDWCAIVAATPKKLSFVYGKGSSSPLYDVQLEYLIGIAGNKAYYLALTKRITWDYVVVEVSKDASSWTVLRMMSPDSGMGICKKDDDGFQPQECWRRIPLRRVAGTDEMRFEDFGLSWKISKDSCAAARPN